MNPWFLDTHYFLALRNPRDEAHAQALAVTSQFRNRPLLTTAWVLTEVADALAKPTNRAGFAELMRLLTSDPAVTIVPPSSDLFERGITLYNARSDKDWSLTDCISFVVMTEQGLSEAVTGDHHFEQAGFQALLK